MLERLKWSVRLRRRSEQDGLASPPEDGAGQTHATELPPGVSAAADARTSDEDRGGHFVHTPSWEGPPHAVIHARRVSNLE